MQIKRATWNTIGLAVPRLMEGLTRKREAAAETARVALPHQRQRPGSNQAGDAPLAALSAGLNANPARRQFGPPEVVRGCR
jgi:hypothetical protein